MSKQPSFFWWKTTQLKEGGRMTDIQMGETARDNITGFTGIVTGRSEYINGCIHLMIETKAKAGMKPVHAWFDIDRCVRVRSTARKTVPRTRNGGPMPHSND